MLEKLLGNSSICWQSQECQQETNKQQKAVQDI